MKIVAIVALSAALLLGACETNTTPAEKQIDAGQVVKVAQAPDGTVLWAVKGVDTTRAIYFSSNGTNKLVGCGKNCYRMEQTPNAPAAPEPLASPAPAPAQEITGQVVNSSRNADGTVTLTLRP